MRIKLTIEHHHYVKYYGSRTCLVANALKEILPNIRLHVFKREILIGTHLIPHSYEMMDFIDLIDTKTLGGNRDLPEAIQLPKDLYLEIPERLIFVD